MQKVITDCGDCPFLNVDGEHGSSCNLQNCDNEIEGGFVSNAWKYKTPDWCPVKRGPITIHFKGTDPNPSLTRRLESEKFDKSWEGVPSWQIGK
jgi:hypothetical protein